MYRDEEETQMQKMTPQKAFPAARDSAAIRRVTPPVGHAWLRSMLLTAAHSVTIN